ncbi:GNAT family N-acetyltransferase [Streptomyces laculatispora]|uniref:GNAT family N-acetyltransferase n=1 Tax=Streptomyces laculatispora TaxID=887464 RepID=UPI001A94C7B7|nr:GNAT family N-acetyltransferase [Streptomyces laculatispora]MBO0913931.1 GNAT family N-acetyltransferase [Streptomyces laculatispora]
MDMDIRRLDPHDEDRAEAVYRALRAGASADREAPVVEERDALLTSLRENESNPNTDRRVYGAWQGMECLGALLLGLPRRENTHTAKIEVSVPPGARHQGVGTALFIHARDLALAEGRRLLAAEVNAVGSGEAALAESPGGRFAVALGFAAKHTELRLLLDLPPAELRLRRLEGDAAARSVGYEAVGWVGLPPPQLIDAFAELHTLMAVAVPSGELSREPLVYDAERVRGMQQRLLDQGYSLVTTLLLDPKGRPAGYTSMCVMGGGNREVLQEDTFVLRTHRGRALGTRAKVANLRLLAKHFPHAEHVHTWTAEVNDAMRAVNDRLGFRPVETLYELELDVLLEPPTID